MGVERPDGAGPEANAGGGPGLRAVPAMILVGLIYYVTARLGLNFALVEGTVTPLWPATGVAVVGLLLFGKRVWPGIAAAALLVNLPLVDAPVVAVGIAAGNTAAPLVASALLDLVGFRPALDRTRDALSLVVLAALGGMLVSATAGTATLAVFDVIGRDRVVATWSVWWVGDAMGVLAVAPFLLAVRSVKFHRPIRWLRLVEAVVLLAAIGGSAFLMRTSADAVWVLVFPLLGIGAWRFRQLGAAPAALLVVSIASWTAADGLGPFAGLRLTDMMVALQVFNAAVALTSFFFASVVAERAAAAEELSRSAATLESAVFERTFELQRANRRLEIQIAEREEAERILRQRENQLAEAQEVARLGSWEWEIATDEVWWSDELYRLYGLRPRSVQITYEAFLERVHPADRQLTMDAVQSAVAAGETLAYQHRIILPDGSERTLAAHGRVVTDDDGTPLRIVGTAQDITERANAERALRESEKLFRGLFETAAIGIAQCDPMGEVVHVNPAFSALFDGAEHITGSTLNQLVDDDDRARFDDLFDRMQAGTLASFEIELRLRGPRPDPVWASANVSLVTDTDGHPKLIQVLTHDLSERRRAEALARADDERARLRSMFAMVPAAVVVLSGPDHTIEFTNEAFTRFAGGRSLIGMTIRDAFPEVEHQGYFERLDEVYRTGKPYAADEAAVGLTDPRSGELISGFFNFVFQPLPAPDGSVEGILMHAVDVTDAVRSRMALSESLAFLDTLLATAPAGFAVFDEQFRYMRINERLAQMNGRSVQSHLGRTPSEVLPEHADVIEAILERVLSDREPVLDVEISRPGSGGDEVRHWLASYYPIESSDKVLLGIGAVTVDITERKRMEALLAAQKEVMEVIARGTDLDPALEALTVVAEEQSSGDVRASILLLDDTGQRLRHGAAPHLPKRFIEAIDGVAIGEDVGSCGAAAARRETVLVSDIATHPNWTEFRHLALSSNLRAAWSAPVIASDGSVLGAFCMYCSVPRAPSPQEMRLLEVLSRTTALAIERHRAEEIRRQLTERERQAQRDLYEREHRIAETLQRSLLPERLPESIDVAIAARYIPASTDVEVGGDWYDIIPLGNGRLGLVIGDVAGHGINAAAAMGQLRMALRAYAMEDVGPAEALGRLNNLLVELQPGSMATLAYGHLDQDSGRLTMARAGHPPPLLIHRGEVTRLEEGLAPPLGVVPMMAFEEATITVPTGATLLLYTDGLIERRGESVDDGIERLIREVSAAPEDLEDACDHVIERLLAGHIGDDTALLGVRRLSLAGRLLHLELPTEPARLAPMRHVLRRWLDQNGLEPVGVEDVLVAVTEACSNAIQHAYGNREGTLTIDGAIRDDELTLSVRDAGTWRPPRDDGAPDERGRGLNLIHGMMDSVEIVSGREGTEVRMRRRVRELVDG